MDHGVFNISSAKLCSKLISVELEVMEKKIARANNRMACMML